MRAEMGISFQLQKLIMAIFKMTLIMKKTTKFSAIFMASMIVAAACTKEAEVENGVIENTPTETYTLTVNAGSPETKTVFGDKVGTSYPITWSATGEVIKLAEVYTPAEGDAVVAAFPSTGYTLTNENATAKFTVDLTAKADAGTYDYRVIYPSTAYTAVYPANNDLGVVIPGTQTPTATSPDPAATVLYAEVTGLTEQPTSTLDLDFSHIAAYGKMTIKNAGSAIGGGESIESVTVSVPAGGVYYYWSNGNTTPVGATKTDEVVVNTDNLDTSSNFDVWFACRPYSLAIGDILTVKITTDAKTYVRNIIMSKAMAFTSGEVSKFGVDMSTAAPLLYSTVFNYALSGAYNSGTPVEGADAGGTKWYITYGNWNGSNCAQFRVYKAANFGALYNSFDCSYVTNVFYDAYVSNTSLKLDTFYSTDSGASWTQVDDDKTLTTSSKRYGFVVSSTGAYPKVRIKFVAAGTAPTGSGNYALTIDNVEIYGKGVLLEEPSITADNITGVPAIGVTGANATYAIHNFAGADDIVATYDGTVVTGASVDNDGHITYTVAPNYGTASRSTGTITLTSAAEGGVNKVISVSQLGETFSASAETVTIAKDATTGSFTITTPTFGWNVQVNQADGKNLVLTSSTSGDGNADPQTVTFSSSTEATSSEQTLGTIMVYRNGNISDGQAKTITIKKASNAGASTYTKVTTLTAGAQYLLVNTADSKVATGTLSSNTLQSASVTISGGTTITGSDTIDGYAMTITALSGDDSGCYSLLINSQYIGCKSSGTDIQLNASVASDYFKWSIHIDGETGLATITNKSRTDRFIGWNGSAGWKAYSTSNYDSYPRPYLFKKN